MSSEQFSIALRVRFSAAGKSASILRKPVHIVNWLDGFMTAHTIAERGTCVGRALKIERGPKPKFNEANMQLSRPAYRKPHEV